jgi:hypothetical protein
MYMYINQAGVEWLSLLEVFSNLDFAADYDNDNHHQEDTDNHNNDNNDRLSNHNDNDD